MPARRSAARRASGAARATRPATTISTVNAFGTATSGAATGHATGASTINDAIASTDTGGTVNVLEGTYRETATISKSLTLLGAQHGVAKRQRREVDVAGGRGLGERQHVRRRAGDHFRREVLDQQQLPVGVAARHGHHDEPEQFRAVVHAEAAGEQAVPVGIVEHVAWLRPACGKRPRAATSGYTG